MWARAAWPSVVFGLALAIVGSEATAGADDRCEIGGTVRGIEVAVRLERGMRRVQIATPTRVVVTPLRTGVARVRTLEGEQVEGTTRAELRWYLARPISLREGILELEAGIPVERVAVSPRGPWVRIDVALGEGLYLRRAEVPCEVLRVATGDDTIAPRATPVPIAGPRWGARTGRVYLFDRIEGEGALRIDVMPEAPARFVEIERRERWVRIALQTERGARLRGWVHDEDLSR